jgi:hypothetical protein
MVAPSAARIPAEEQGDGESIHLRHLEQHGPYLLPRERHLCEKAELEPSVQRRCRRVPAETLSWHELWTGAQTISTIWPNGLLATEAGGFLVF